MEEIAELAYSDTRGSNMHQIYTAAEQLVSSESFTSEEVGVDLEVLSLILDSALSYAMNNFQPEEGQDDEDLFRTIVNQLQVTAFVAGMIFAEEESGAIPDAQVLISTEEVSDLVKSLIAKRIGTVRIVVGDIE